MDAECALESTTKAAQPVERAGAQEDKLLPGVVFEEVDIRSMAVVSTYQLL